MHRPLFALFLALFAGGCQPDDANDDDQVDSCPNPPATELVPGALESGFGNAETFIAYSEGRQVSLTLGPQGGYMILPRFRIDTALIATDGVCAHLDVTASVEGLEPLVTSLTLPERTDSGQYWITSEVLVFLSTTLSSVANKPCQLEGVFREDERYTTSAVGLVLLPPP